MPLVRISLPADRTNALSERVSQGVHSAMVDTFNVPEDDRFQIISEYVPGEGMIWPDSFLGITHGSMVAFVQITCAEGRSVEQKKALFAAIAANLARVGVPANDVIINLVETARENWSFGNGLAPFALN